MSWASERQKKLWYSAPVGEFSRAGMTLTHPAFSRDFHLTNWVDEFQGEVGGFLVTFETHPFNFAWPEISPDGRADMTLDIHNSGQSFVSEIEAAARYLDLVSGELVPVAVEMNDYIIGDTRSQIDPIRFELANLAIDEANCSGTAMGCDTLNAGLPSGAYTPDRFPGLVRE